jgi:hypothetical protein
MLLKFLSKLKRTNFGDLLRSQIVSGLILKGLPKQKVGLKNLQVGGLQLTQKNQKACPQVIDGYTHCLGRG